MDRENILGHNIRALRNAYGETQEGLGAVLGVEKNTVSYYENGKREPSRDMLSEIAKHYMVSVEELTFCDLSGIGKVNIDKNTFWRNIEIVFPLVKTDTAMSNVHFAKAYFLHKEFFEELHKSSFDKIDNLDVCYDEYDEAYKDESIKAEVAANSLGLLYLFMMMMKLTPEIMKNKPAVMTQLAVKDKEARKVLENTDSSLEEDAKEFSALFDDPEFVEMITEMKTVLKKSHRWSSLADYYIALEYIYNNVSNGLGWDFNRRIGMEMLDAFASVGNTYAIRFTKLSIEAVTGSSQSVDDK